MSTHFTRKKVIIVAVVALLGLGITKGLSCRHQGDSSRKQISSSKLKKVGIQTFIKYTYNDPMARMEAFSLLIPKGWQTQGSISWSANPALPAQSHFRFFNPKSIEEFSVFPTQAYFWTNNPLFLSTHPAGSIRFGTLVAKPVDLHTAFAEIIIPNFRGNVRDLKIIEKKEVPALARLAKGTPTRGVRASAVGGKIRIEYLENRKHIEEEIYAAVSQFVIPQPGSAYSINYWYIDYIFSFKSEKGRLDSLTKIFQTMLYSFQINPQYFAKVVNVKELLAQQAIRNIRTVGRIGNMVSQAGSQMREDQHRDWEQRQRVKDEISKDFSDYIRGVQRYNDPHTGKEVELPAGYEQAWSNNLGEYIVSDSPSYNPNVGSNLHWEALTPK